MKRIQPSKKQRTLTLNKQSLRLISGGGGQLGQNQIPIVSTRTNDMMTDETERGTVLCNAPQGR